LELLRKEKFIRVFKDLNEFWIDRKSNLVKEDNSYQMVYEEPPYATSGIEVKIKISDERILKMYGSYSLPQLREMSKGGIYSDINRAIKLLYSPSEAIIPLSDEEVNRCSALQREFALSGNLSEEGREKLSRYIERYIQANKAIFKPFELEHWKGYLARLNRVVA